ncbi:12913_t:CDS:2, partial [Funneliformis geosporum]
GGSFEGGGSLVLGNGSLRGGSLITSSTFFTIGSAIFLASSGSLAFASIDKSSRLRW